jgi:aminoglycoside phosphotransferase (APT) family kinase protein
LNGLSKEKLDKMTHEEWHADIEITEKLVRDCLKEQFPELLPIETLICIGEGWDNKVFLLNQKYIFRFPRRKIAVELIEQENKLLRFLPDFSPVRIPKPQFIGMPSKKYPYPFQGYEFLQGIPAYQANLDDKARVSILPALAGFLKTLHSIDEAQALSMGAQKQTFSRTYNIKSIKVLREKAQKIIGRHVFPLNEKIFSQEMDAAEKIILPQDAHCLVHGDLDPRHLLIHHQQLSAVIDWGDVGINHKAADLDIIWTFFPSECHADFFRLYGNIDENTWQYARFLGIYKAFILSLYAHDIQDQLMLRESLNAIQRINPALFICKSKNRNLQDRSD